MYRRFYLIGFLFALSFKAFATDLFYGIAIINQEVDIAVTTGATTTTSTDDGTGLGLYADMYYKGTYRFNGTFSYIDYTNFYTTSATAAADYLIPLNASTTFFVGVTGGAIGQVYNDSSLSDMAMSYLVGAQLGAIMFAGDHLMIELGYRVRSTDLETDLTTLSAVAAIDELNETYLSINIIF